MRRSIDILFFLLLVVGAYLFVQSGREKAAHRKNYERLITLVGDLPISDPAKVYFKALPTDDPMEFAWRIYFPANYHEHETTNLGSHGACQHSTSRDAVGRVRFKTDKDGFLTVYTRMLGGSTTLRLGGSKPLSEFVQAHWAELHIDQLGKDQVAIMGPRDAGTILQLALPKHLQQEVQKNYPLQLQNRVIPFVFQLKLDPTLKGP